MVQFGACFWHVISTWNSPPGLNKVAVFWCRNVNNIMYMYMYSTNLYNLTLEMVERRQLHMHTRNFVFLFFRLLNLRGGGGDRPHRPPWLRHCWRRCRICHELATYHPKSLKWLYVAHTRRLNTKRCDHGIICLWTNKSTQLRPSLFFLIALKPLKATTGERENTTTPELNLSYDCLVCKWLPLE